LAFKIHSCFIDNFKLKEMATYYRFQNDKPLRGEVVHCFTNFRDFKSFVEYMKSVDNNSNQMKYWEVEGTHVRDDDGDVVVQVTTAREIKNL
jgi:hypothetical protein